MKKYVIKIIQTLLIIIVYILMNKEILNRPIGVILLLVIIFADRFFERNNVKN